MLRNAHSCNTSNTSGMKYNIYLHTLSMKTQQRFLNFTKSWPVENVSSVVRSFPEMGKRSREGADELCQWLVYDSTCLNNMFALCQHRNEAKERKQ